MLGPYHSQSVRQGFRSILLEKPETGRLCEGILWTTEPSHSHSMNSIDKLYDQEDRNPDVKLATTNKRLRSFLSCAENFGVVTATSPPRATFYTSPLLASTYTPIAITCSPPTSRIFHLRNMPEDTGNGSYASGASTPTSPNFDPGASEFVPKRTPATDGRTASGQLRAAFNTIPGLGSSSRRSARPPLPLFSTSTWSPSNDQPIRSAGVPSKPVWDGSIGRNHALNSSQSQASPSRGFNGGTPQGLFLNSPLSGRGMSSDGNGRDDRTHRAKVSPGFPTIRYEQTTEYHTSQPTPKSAPQGSFISRTDPLPQQPFFWSDREAPASSSGSNASQQAAVPSTPNSSASSFATQAFNEYNGFDDQTSPASGSVVISDHYSKTHPEQAGTKSKVWKERHHTQGLRRALKDPHADWEEAYPGALGILTCMNPETYQMPFGVSACSYFVDIDVLTFLYRLELSTSRQSTPATSCSL